MELGTVTAVRALGSHCLALDNLMVLAWCAVTEEAAWTVGAAVAKELVNCAKFGSASRLVVVGRHSSPFLGKTPHGYVWKCQPEVRSLHHYRPDGCRLLVSCAAGLVDECCSAAVTSA